MENPLFEYVYVFFSFILENYFPKKKIFGKSSNRSKNPAFSNKIHFFQTLKR